MTVISEILKILENLNESFKRLLNKLKKLFIAKDPLKYFEY